MFVQTHFQRARRQAAASTATSTTTTTTANHSTNNLSNHHQQHHSIDHKSPVTNCNGHKTRPETTNKTAIKNYCTGNKAKLKHSLIIEPSKSVDYFKGSSSKSRDHELQSSQVVANAQDHLKVSCCCLLERQQDLNSISLKNFHQPASYEDKSVHRETCDLLRSRSTSFTFGHTVKPSKSTRGQVQPEVARRVQVASNINERLPKYRSDDENENHITANGIGRKLMNLMSEGVADPKEHYNNNSRRQVDLIEIDRGDGTGCGLLAGEDEQFYERYYSNFCHAYSHQTPAVPPTCCERLNIVDNDQGIFSYDKCADDILISDTHHVERVIEGKVADDNFNNYIDSKTSEKLHNSSTIHQTARLSKTSDDLYLDTCQEWNELGTEKIVASGSETNKSNNQLTSNCSVTLHNQIVGKVFKLLNDQTKSHKSRGSNEEKCDLKSLSPSTLDLVIENFKLLSAFCIDFVNYQFDTIRPLVKLKNARLLGARAITIDVSPATNTTQVLSSPKRKLYRQYSLNMFQLGGSNEDNLRQNDTNNDYAEFFQQDQKPLPDQMPLYNNPVAMQGLHQMQTYPIANRANICLEPETSRPRSSHHARNDHLRHNRSNVGYGLQLSQVDGHIGDICTFESPLTTLPEQHQLPDVNVLEHFQEPQVYKNHNLQTICEQRHQTIRHTHRHIHKRPGFEQDQSVFQSGVSTAPNEQVAGQFTRQQLDRFDNPISHRHLWTQQPHWQAQNQTPMAESLHHKQAFRPAKSLNSSPWTVRAPNRYGDNRAATIDSPTRHFDRYNSGISGHNHPQQAQYPAAWSEYEETPPHSHGNWRDTRMMMMGELNSAVCLRQKLEDSGSIGGAGGRIVKVKSDARQLARSSQYTRAASEGGAGCGRKQSSSSSAAPSATTHPINKLTTPTTANNNAVLMNNSSTSKTVSSTRLQVASSLDTDRSGAISSCASNTTTTNASDEDDESTSCKLSNRPINHQKKSLSPLSRVVSLAGAKKRLGFKQKGALNSLSVHRSEEILPAGAGRILLNSHFHSLYQGHQPMTSRTQSKSLNESSIDYNEDDEADDDNNNDNSSAAHWLALNNHHLHQHHNQKLHCQAFSTNAKVCFVEGLGVGQVASRQALVSPYLGDVQLSLTDRRGFLEVEVIRVRQLQTKPLAKRLPSPYVKVYLMKGKKCLAKFKTSQAKCCLDPLFQQRFIFRDSSYANCVLQVIVWGDYGKKDRKSLMGLCQIHLNDLDMSSVVIGWYKLFNAPSLANFFSLASSSKSLRQTISSSRLVERLAKQKSADNLDTA